MCTQCNFKLIFFAFKKVYLLNLKIFFFPGIEHGQEVPGIYLFFSIPFLNILLI